MCDTDDGPVRQRIVERTASKQHVCYECKKPIMPGDKYEDFSGLYIDYHRVNGKWQNMWWGCKTCLGCLRIREDVQEESEDGCFVFGEVLERAEEYGIINELL